MKPLAFLSGLIIIFSSYLCETLAQCNGLNSICDKRLNEVCFLMTHNAYNYAPAFNFPNQNFPVSQQLQDGVRGFMLDVYESNGELIMYHGLSTLGSEPLEPVILDMKNFLDANSNDIIVIIFENNADVWMYDSLFNHTGFSQYLFPTLITGNWPSISSMIDSNQRVVVFFEDQFTSTPWWYNYVWDHTVETDYSVSNINNFSCDFNRGNAANPLFLMNHFVTDLLFGTGEPSVAPQVNDPVFLSDRVNQCYNEKGKWPNFIGVDFYDLGDALTTVQTLNDTMVGYDELLAIPKEFIMNIENSTLVISNNPMPLDMEYIGVYSVLGKRVFSSAINPSQRTIKISIETFQPGIYFVSMACNATSISKSFFLPPR